jgi:hypothetical protein
MIGDFQCAFDVQPTSPGLGSDFPAHVASDHPFLCFPYSPVVQLSILVFQRSNSSAKNIRHQGNGSASVADRRLVFVVIHYVVRGSGRIQFVSEEISRNHMIGNLAAAHKWFLPGLN